LAGLGAFFCLNSISLLKPDLKRPLALGLVLLPLVFTLPDTLKANNISHHYLVEDYSGNLLESLPPESVAITVSDSSYFPLAYSTFVERKRDDILVLYGDSDEISTQVSPIWKHAHIFPGLPVKGHFLPVSLEYLKSKPVYAFEPSFLPKATQDDFKATPFINSFMLIPTALDFETTELSRDFERAFDLMVYERSLKEKASDVYSAELKMSMFIPVSHYAFLLKEDGHIDASNKYYEEALRLITAKGLAHYVTYLKTTERRAEGEAFLEAIEPQAKQDPDIRKLSDEIRKEFM
jgi:hypothetical protein